MAFCTSCGSQVDEGTRFCQKCGQPMTTAAPAVYAAQPGPTPAGKIYAGTPPMSPAYVAAPTSQYGGFWIRFVAYVIDSLIVGIPMTIIVVIGVFAFGAFGGITALHNLPNNPDPEQVQQQVIPMLGAIIGAYAMFFLIAIGISWLYFALMESSERQATFGKAALNLRVSDANGNRLSFAHASGRFFSKIITGLVPLGIGYIMAGFTQKKQALHDFIAGTIVTRTL
jgi:uncharacterized RDD family membrane protein YckC